MLRAGHWIWHLTPWMTMNFNACYLSCRSLSGDDSFHWCIPPNIFHHAMCTGVLWVCWIRVSPLRGTRLLSRPGALAAPPPAAPSVPGRLTPPPLSPAGRGGGALPPRLQDLLRQLGPPADGCLPRLQDLPLCAEWQRRQHPRQRRRWRRRPRPPQTLLFPGVKPLSLLFI